VKLRCASSPICVAELCHARGVLTCEECRCVSESGRGWLGYIAEDPEDGEGPLVVTYCPPCAAREQAASTRAHEYE
jgi:hypothetical protein